MKQGHTFVPRWPPCGNPYWKKVPFSSSSHLTCTPGMSSSSSKCKCTISNVQWDCIKMAIVNCNSVFALGRISTRRPGLRVPFLSPDLAPDANSHSMTPRL